MSTPAPQQKVSPEFFVRVNDFLAMAHRIAKRHTIAHAQMALLHAFARYSAHHYLTTAKDDSTQLREEFSRYLGAVLGDLFMQNVNGMAGPAGAGAPAAANAQAADAGSKSDGAE